VNKDGISGVIKGLKDNNNFLITAHIDPEGDSIGSQLAIHCILSKLKKKALIVNHHSVPNNLRFLKHQDLVTCEIPENFQPDAAIILDCPVKERAGKISNCFSKIPLIINIDHHISNEFFGDINWVDPEASSVGEMIFLLCEKLSLKIDKDAAEAIYTAIMTDTGMFNYDNTSSRTHSVAGKLINIGVKPKEIYKNVFEQKSISELRLLGMALATLKIDGTMAYMELTRDMYAAVGVDSISTDEFIKFPRSIKGIEACVFFKESGTPCKQIKVSFRSSGKLDINNVASLFGGGGHPQAAGCALDCSLAEAKEKVLAELKRALKDQ